MDTSYISLFLFNTLSKKKEAFVPIDPNNVGMYVCGPTVYERPHLGNARPLVVFDVLFRLLQRLYPKVTYVRNITDVDDKINKAARERGTTIDVITQQTIDDFHGDADALSTLYPTHEPRATQEIDSMVSMIETLIQKGFAYASEGHVLFRTQRFTPYGRLSGQRQEEIMAGSRIEVESYKEHPSDFVLWKPSDDGDPFWSSPWGKGRPGWHIECSAMSHRWLGTTFDIHGGGIDLVFPHHENEIAQTCGAFDVSIMARYWLHNGHLMVHGKKMSKSLGNFMTVKDLLEHHDGEVVRFCLLHTHYRQPLDFHESMLAQGRNVLDRWYNALRGDEMDHHMDDAKPWEYDTPSPISKEFLSILCDDMNTPAAITWIHAQVDNLYQQRCPTARLALQKQIKACARMLGLLNLRPTQWFQQSKKTHDHSCLSDEDIAHLIQQRNDARKVRDFNTADAIRKKLAHQHITLEDTPSTTLWRRN